MEKYHQVRFSPLIDFQKADRSIVAARVSADIQRSQPGDKTVGIPSQPKKHRLWCRIGALLSVFTLTRR